MMPAIVFVPAIAVIAYSIHEWTIDFPVGADSHLKQNMIPSAVSMPLVIPADVFHAPVRRLGDFQDQTDVAPVTAAMPIIFMK
ncbi:MAG TPA: hypothetical protein DDZ04_06235 [Parabacteroides sp.]|nr:hypothetical protein [Parabacteroides sp.]